MFLQLNSKIRETETMDPAGMLESYEASGTLPDDEDLEEAIDDLIYSDESNSEEYDSFEESGSGDTDEIPTTLDTPTSTLGNRIPEDDPKKIQPNVNEPVLSNEVILNKKSEPKAGDQTNEIIMASTARDGFFQRTEVVVALIAGGLVGLLFAISIIVLLYCRMKKKVDASYDPVKKPIYTKARTNEDSIA
ncbi:syndecan-4 isoform X2 [Ascaphus truei]|uniref:syndecan-4 isoform X2 n=1 Tax=Ascaphus truei TaxID=8439 RepID=UPI003F5A7BCE